MNLPKGTAEPNNQRIGQPAITNQHIRADPEQQMRQCFGFLLQRLRQIFAVGRTEEGTCSTTYPKPGQGCQRCSYAQLAAQPRQQSLPVRHGPGLLD